MLARPLALGTGLPLISHAVERIRETRSQVGLTLVERKTNIAGAFKGNPSVTTGKRILIVDDVATSGATLNECAAALLEAGALYVYGLTLARAGAKEGTLPADQ
jgi:predicted amidophosphoribosyltransferase